MGASAEAELARSFKRDDHYTPQLLWSLTAEDWRQYRLSAGRYSPDDAAGKIAKAIEAVKEQLRPRSGEASDQPPLYPFFISDRRKPN